VAPASTATPLMTGESKPVIQVPLTSGFARTGFEQEEAAARPCRPPAGRDQVAMRYKGTTKGGEGSWRPRRKPRRRAWAVPGGEFIFADGPGVRLWDKQTGQTLDKPPALLDGVGIAQRLNEQLPLG